MIPIFYPSADDMIQFGRVIMFSALFVLGIWLLAEWVLKMKRRMEAEHEEQMQSAPADPAQFDAPWGMDDRVVRRRKNRDRGLT
jgi:hypothetical protein